MRKCLYSIIITASCFFLSCSKETVYSKFQPIQNKVWNKQSEYFFMFEISDILIPYNIAIQIRNNDIYPYQNLWILSEEKQTDDIFVRDTIEFMLADDFGKWTGKGISVFQSHMSLRNNYHFPDTGTYTIGIRHGMRDEKLKGIENIGLIIEKSE